MVRVRNMVSSRDTVRFDVWFGFEFFFGQCYSEIIPPCNITVRIA